MEKLLLKPIKRIDGQLNLPGSKSLSNRILLLSSLATGTTDVQNLLDSDDTGHMLNALQKLVVDLTLSEDKTSCRVD